MAMNENTVRKMREEAEALLDRVLVLLGDLGTGERLGLTVGRQRRLDRVGQLVVGLAAIAGDDDRVDEPGFADELLGRGEVEQRERRATRRRHVAVAGDADERELARPGLGDDLDRVADLVVPVLGCAACRGRPRRRSRATGPR